MRACDDRGGIAIYCAIITVALLAVIGVLVDGGGKLRATERADAIAMEAARAGGQAIDPGQAIPGNAVVVDPAGARAAATAYLNKAGVTGSVTVSGDGKTLTVRVNTTYATRFLSIVGVGSMQVTGHGKATLIHGVVAPEGA
jgi:Flp pilus assembly protein TadG